MSRRLQRPSSWAFLRGQSPAFDNGLSRGFANCCRRSPPIPDPQSPVDRSRFLRRYATDYATQTVGAVNRAPVAPTATCLFPDRNRVPEVGLEPTRHCWQRILSAAGSDGQVTVALQSPAFARVCRCSEWRVLRGSCCDSCQLRNTQRNRPHQASPQIGPLGERCHPTRQAPQRGPILLHVWLLDFFQNSGVRRACASQPTPALRAAATSSPP